ncbi:MAG: transposase [Candidatus Gracilibacteria bacterium]
MQKLVLEFTKEDFSSYTLSPLLVKYMEKFLHMESLFEANLSIKKRFSRFSIGKLSFLSVLLILLGIERFSHLSAQWVRETGLAKVIGIRSLPRKTTFADFLNSFSGYHTAQLKRIHKILIREHREEWLPSSGPYFIDLDLSTKSVEGKKIQAATLGYNKKRKGRLCLQWSRALFCGIPFWSKLFSGNTNSKQSLREDLRELMQEITAYTPVNKSSIVIRLDGGYWSPELLGELDYPFIIHGPMLKELDLKTLIKNKKTAWNAYSDTTSFVDLGKRDLSCGLCLRVILVRQLERSQKPYSKNSKPKFIYYPIMTDLTHWSGKGVIRGYRGRQVIESHFKEVNQAFYSNKLPSGRLRANEAFLWFVTFAYTVSVFFKRNSLTNLLSRDELQKLPC